LTLTLLVAVEDTVHVAFIHGVVWVCFLN